MTKDSNAERSEQRSTIGGRKDGEDHTRETNEEPCVNIVCVSPKTDTLYQSRGVLSRDIPGIIDVEEGTSESSRRLRAEAEQIYDELFKNPEASST